MSPPNVYRFRMRIFAVIVALAFVAVSGQMPALADDAPAVTETQGGFVPPKPKRGFRYPDCFCTDSEGQRVEIGQTSCLQIGSTQYLARCGMSLNNPAWRRVAEGCPTS